MGNASNFLMGMFHNIHNYFTNNRITNLEKDLEEVREEFFKLTEKKYQLEQRNQRLNETLALNFSKAFDDFRQFKNGIRLQKPCERDEVTEEMKLLWRLKQSHDDEIAIIKKDIKALDKEINVNKKELKKWTDYKETGRSDLDKLINHLKQEIVSMGNNYEIIIGKWCLFE